MWPGRHSQELDRPIFLIGCGKSGTSMLGALMVAHPEIGPKPRQLEAATVQQFLDALTDDRWFGPIASRMEQKKVWDKVFPIGDVPLRVGRELTLLANPLTDIQRTHLITGLTRRFQQARFFSKAPFNTFRVHALRELFPDARFVAIHRDGRDVVASWGRKQNRWQQLGGYEPAIRIMARKWTEAVEHIETFRDELQIKVIHYDDLVAKPQDTLQEIMNFCDLTYPHDIYSGVALANRTGLWKDRVPQEFHDQLTSATQYGLQLIAGRDDIHANRKAG